MTNDSSSYSSFNEYMKACLDDLPYKRFQTEEIIHSVLDVNKIYKCMTCFKEFKRNELYETTFTHSKQCPECMSTNIVLVEDI